MVLLLTLSGRRGLSLRPKHNHNILVGLSETLRPVCLYEVETRAFNQAVKRNIKRFPADFMFQLPKQEWENLRMQIEALENSMSSQFVMTYPSKRPLSALPYVFTEQGVAMLSGILNSERAINMNIAIMRAFVELRRVLLQQTDIKEQLKLIQERLSEHDVQLNQI